VGTIIIGIGNPVLADDSVGLKIADCLEDRLRGRPGVAVSRLCCGGMRVMEAMAGHERAIIIDAAVGGGGAPGTVYSLGADGFSQTRNICSSHDGGLPVALELGRAVGLRLPRDVRIWAVEAGDVLTYSEELTAEVQRAVPLVVEHVIRDLDASQVRLSGRTTQ
jgi:hydrogenase maturation protease